MKKLLFVLSLLFTSQASAIDLNLTYPGELWLKYYHNVRNDGTDYEKGLMFANVLQGVQYKRNMLYVGGSLYQPLLYTDGRDNFLQVGVKHRTAIGLDFGIEKQYVQEDINRIVVFTEFYKTWE